MADTILVTGASGAVGRHLVATLDPRRWRVRALDLRAPVDPPPGLEVVVASIEDAGALRAAAAGASAVVHLAGLATPGYAWEEYQRVNVDGTRNVLEAARSEGVARVVFASTNHVSGRTPLAGLDGLDEGAPFRPDSYYGVSKAAGETLARLYHDRHGLDVVCLRIGTFAERPSERRHLWSWLSPGDLTRVVEAALTAPAPGYAVVWAVSANRDRVTSTRGAEAIGYRPLDDAARAAAGLELADEPLGRLYLGGAFAAADVDGPTSTR